MTRPPSFRDLLGDDLPAEERRRLERVHDLLVEAGPPPELPPSLAEAPGNGAQSPSWLPRRRLGAAFSLAAAIALVAFLGGYVAGLNKSEFEPTREVAMQGTAAQPDASALIRLGSTDAAGNLSMVVSVRGLPRLAKPQYYELYLTRNGKPVASCGTFNVQQGTTTLDFTVPYSLKRFDGWIVTRWEPNQEDVGPVLLTT
jgi:Anti-sigma-K factor rskA